MSFPRHVRDLEIGVGSVRWCYEADSGDVGVGDWSHATRIVLAMVTTKVILHCFDCAVFRLPLRGGRILGSRMSGSV